MGFSFVIRVSFAFSKTYGDTTWGYPASLRFPSRFLSLTVIVGEVILCHSDFLRFSKAYRESRWGFPSSFGFPLRFLSLFGILGRVILRH